MVGSGWAGGLVLMRWRGRNTDPVFGKPARWGIPLAVKITRDDREGGALLRRLRLHHLVALTRVY